MGMPGRSLKTLVIRKSVRSEYPEQATTSRSAGVSWSVVQVSSTPRTMPTIWMSALAGSEARTVCSSMPASSETSVRVGCCT